MRYLHVTFLAIFPVLPVSPGGGCVEGRRRGSIPADPSWVLRRLMGVASSELAVVEGRQASSPTDRPKPAGVAGKPASSAEGAFSLWPNDVAKWRWRPCAGWRADRVSGQSPIDPPRACDGGWRSSRKLDFVGALLRLRHAYFQIEGRSGRDKGTGHRGPRCCTDTGDVAN